MVSTATVFMAFVGLHIVSGSIGLISFWVPVAGNKGNGTHRYFGVVFINSLLLTGATAVGIAITTLIDPTGTHPHLVDHPDFQDAGLISAIFGWMMLYLATLTINLAWQGRLSIRNRRNHLANRAWHNLLSQVLLTLAATNCLVQGIGVEQPLMVGISLIGFATVATNLWFIYKPHPTRVDRIKEHIKSLVGAGISVYTAFFAFGAVRLIPELALTPALWSIPLITGLTLIIYHQRTVVRASRHNASTTPATAS